MHDGKNNPQDEVVEEIFADGRIARSLEVTMIFDDGLHVGWE